MAIQISAIPNISSITGIEPLGKPKDATPAMAAMDFGRFLTEALANVEQAQRDAALAAQRLATGEIKDIAQVTIASEKATLALQMTVQVRNKVLEAYQDIMRMPV